MTAPGPMSRLVDVTLYKIYLPALHRPGQHLVTFGEDEPDQVEAARAWLKVRGLERAVSAIDDTAAMMFADGSPSGGFNVSINKTHAILLFARWPDFDAIAFLGHLPELRWLLDPQLSS